MFNNRLVRHEQIDGRDTVVMESIPRSDVAPATQEEATAIIWKQTTWVDTEDLIPVRIEMESVKDFDEMRTGSKVSEEYVRVQEAATTSNPDGRAVWLAKRATGKYFYKVLWAFQVADVESIYSNFKRFRGDVHIIDGSVEEAPAKDKGTDKP
jgi:hypothetical protein